jgi:hypothetical protein
MEGEPRMEGESQPVHMRMEGLLCCRAWKVNRRRPNLSRTPRMEGLLCCLANAARSALSPALALYMEGGDSAQIDGINLIAHGFPAPRSPGSHHLRRQPKTVMNNKAATEVEPNIILGALS